MAALDQAAAVTARPARDVERTSRGQLVEQRPHDGFFDRDDRVAGVVVAVRPRGVAGAGVSLADQFRRRIGLIIEQVPHFGESLCRVGFAAVIEVPEQRQSFDTDEQLAKVHAAAHVPDARAGHDDRSD